MPSHQDVLIYSQFGGGVTDQAWQFRPETYSAKGDGKLVADLVLNSTTTVTSATAGFTSADTGKTIMINGGLGTTATPLVATMTYSSATTVTLSATAAVTGTGFVGVYGSDDTAAINSAVTAAASYATANTYFGEVLLSAKIYMLTSAQAQTGNGSSTPTFNAQIPMPYPNANGTTQKLIIQLTGVGDLGFYEYWESTTPNLAGSVLVSTLTSAPSTPDATFGDQSVLGGPSGSAGFTGGYANVKPVIQGVQIIMPVYTNMHGMNFGYCAGMRVAATSVFAFAPSGFNGGNSPLLKDLPAQGGFQSKIGCGLNAPINQNNANTTADEFYVEGISRGLYVYDHFTAGRIGVLYSDVALKVNATGGDGHLVSVQNFSAEVYNGGLSTSGSGPTQVCHVAINWSAECTSVAYDVSDSGNYLTGVFHFCDPADKRTPTVTGAGRLKIVNDLIGPGAWGSQPSVPASTTNQQNTAWRDAAVSVKGGTVTVVAVDGVTCATATNTTVIVPAGKNITLTYSSAPTWAWTLL